MMEQFSPITRRVIALGILVLGLLLLLNLLIIPIVSLIGESLSELADARFRLDRLEAVVARPPPPASEPVPPSFYMQSASRQAALDALIATINRTAAGYQVQVDSIAPLDLNPERPSWLGVSLTARGEQDKMLAFLNDLERGEPAVHFTNWSLGPGEAASPALANPEGDPIPAPPIGTGAVQLNFSGAATAIWYRA